MFPSNSHPNPFVTSLLKSVALLVIGALVLASASSANAGLMHARAVIGLGVSAQYAGEGGVAHAERHQGSKYRIAHEEFGNNYTYGNAGNGHAHHHSGLFRSSSDAGQDKTNQLESTISPPAPGSRATSQYVKQTWLPTSGGTEIKVSWTPNSFLQIDPSEMSPGRKIVSRVSITAAGGLTGTVELWGRLDGHKKPQIDARLTGIFKNIKFKLVTHPNGVVSVQFSQPVTWTVRGNAAKFDIALDGSIDTTGP
jgi:hypothetical protein